MPAVARRIKGDPAVRWRALSYLDLGVGAGLVAGGLAGLQGLTHRAPSWLAVAACALCCSAVAWRRASALGSVLVAVAAMTIFQLASGARNMAAEPAAVVLCFYMVGRRAVGRKGRQWAAVAVAAGLPATVVIATNSGTSSPFAILLAWVPMMVLPAAAGVFVARREALDAELSVATARLRDEQGARAALAASDERNRVARELHDVVAHGLSVMVIQAGAARLVARSDEDAARASLHVVAASGREAMTDLRRIMGVLRRDDEQADERLGIAQLPNLVDRIRASGLQARLAIAGTPGPLSPAVELTAYRIVQEALTNAVKHANAAAASVLVTFVDGELEIVVVDSGGAGAATHPELSSGHGLVGMRERVALHGGEVRAGPTAEGGWAVHARLPAGIPASMPTRRPAVSHPAVSGPPVSHLAEPRPANRWLPEDAERRSAAIDRAIAAMAAVALEVEVFTSPHRHGPLFVNAVIVGLLASATLWRRRSPLAFLAVMGALAIPLSGGLTSLQWATVTGTYFLFMTTYTIAAWEGRRRAVIGLAAWIAGTAAVALVEHRPAQNFLGASTMACAIWAAGRVIRAQRDLRARLESTSRGLQAEMEDRQRLAVAGERMRIARDLHGLVARETVAMIVQAESALGAAGDPEALMTAARAIEDTGREALSEMRQILGALRSSSAPDLAPQPGLDKIHGLVERSRSSGRTVELAVEGEPGPLLAGDDLVAYRTIESALDAADGTVRISMRFDEHGLRIDVSAPAIEPTPSLMERLAFYDGQLLDRIDGASRLVVQLPRMEREAIA